MYDFKRNQRPATLAAEAVESYLRSLPQTTNVTNVEEDPKYQRVDVDLLWYVRKRVEPYKIEVKGDRYRPINFIFETESNAERGRPGCFLYTTADFILYYFINHRQLYIIPMPQARPWFLANITRFAPYATTTRLPGNQFYTTKGYKVPIELARLEVPEIRFIKL